MAALLKQSLRRAVAQIAPRRSGGVRVLMYHAVDDADPEDRMSLRVPRQRFFEQMTVLRDEHYEVVPLSAVFEGNGTSNRTRVAITFDDGYRSQEWAAATLRDFGFPATFFVVPRFLDGVTSANTYSETWGHLGWSDAAALGDAGFDVGAHSMTHPDLTTCDDARLDEEVAGVRMLLEQRLGRPVPHFSYPYGRYDGRVTIAVKRAGYQLACTSRYGLNRSSGPSFRVNRTEVYGTDNRQDFIRKLHGQYDWLGFWHDLRRTSQDGRGSRAG